MPRVPQIICLVIFPHPVRSVAGRGKYDEFYTSSNFNQLHHDLGSVRRGGMFPHESFGLGLHFRSSGKNSDNILYHIYLFEVPMAITGRFTASIIPPRSKMLTQPLGTSE